MGDRVPTNRWPWRGLQRTNQGFGIEDIFLSFFLFELRRGRTMGQPEVRLTAENLRSSGRVLSSRQLPWEERAGIPVPQCQLEWRSRTLTLSEETWALSLMLNFVWQITPSHWGLDARLKNMNRTEKKPISTRPSWSFSSRKLLHFDPEFVHVRNAIKALVLWFDTVNHSPPHCAHRAEIHPVSSSYSRMIPYVENELYWQIFINKMTVLGGKIMWTMWCFN